MWHSYPIDMEEHLKRDKEAGLDWDTLDIATYYDTFDSELEKVPRELWASATDPYGKTLLCYASKSDKNLASVVKLIAAGSDVNHIGYSTNHLGKTYPCYRPVMNAAHGQPRVLQALLEAGARVEPGDLDHARYEIGRPGRDCPLECAQECERLLIQYMVHS